MSPWISATRPKTLVAGIIPVALGSALAYQQGGFQWAVFLCALGGALAIQVGTNYVNDASDFERGADSLDRLGPPRMAASGLLTPKALYLGAALAFFVALLFGSYLIYAAGPVLLAIGIFSIFFAVIYTAGPFPLAYLGLGDIFVLIFFGLVAVLGTVFAHLHRLPPEATYLALATGFQGVALIAINNLRDIPTDKKVGKKTLAVRLGDRGSRAYYSILVLLPFLLWLPLQMRLGGTLNFLPLLSLPLAFANIDACLRIQDRRQFNRLLGKTAALQMLFGLLAVITLVNAT
ncbi:MAG: 1,4-dihydroxy-2-naphthoate polyprenyltransferase [Bdellovibrionota bacterium]